MGKCVSKDHHEQQIREIDERSYIAISEDFDYYRYEVRSCNGQVKLKLESRD